MCVCERERDSERESERASARAVCMCVCVRVLAQEASKCVVSRTVRAYVSALAAAEVLYDTCDGKKTTCCLIGERAGERASEREEGGKTVEREITDRERWGARNSDRPGEREREPESDQSIRA